MTDKKEMSIREISELTGVSRQTLTNWKKSRVKLFEVVRSGCRKGGAKIFLQNFLENA